MLKVKNEWYPVFKTTCKQLIVNLWINCIKRDYNDQFNLVELKVSGEKYLDILLDIETPLEEHHYYKLINKICDYHIENKTDLEELLRNSHYWREAILEALDRFVLTKEQLSAKDLLTNTTMIHKRIDALQKLVVGSYLHKCNTIIEQKETAINKMHSDRLNELGKMAASMVHEIRNPLTAIQGFIDLIEESTSTSKGDIQPYLTIIKAELNNLNGNISGFLRFSKNSGMDESPQNYLLQDLLDYVHKLMYPRLVEVNIELEIEVKEKSVLYVQQIGMQQVMTNLLGNSIDALSTVDYPRKIKISSHSDETFVYIIVTDNGPGIPKEIQDQLFEPFITGKSNGTGLGLSICQEILRKNNGSISFTSKKGETSFRLSFLRK